MKITKLAPNFSATNLTVLFEKGANEVIATYTSTYRDAEYFHLRTLYFDGACWNPGKGFSVPAAQSAAFCTAAAAALAKTAKPRIAKRRAA